jgi:hypothetical protein
MVPAGGKTMAKFTQEDLARMHAVAMRNAAHIEELKRSGSTHAEAMNAIFGAAMFVGAVWRKKRGGFEQTPMKGIEHLIRISESGVPERISETYYDPGSAVAAYAIQKIYLENPDARWFDGDEEGHYGLR